MFTKESIILSKGGNFHEQIKQEFQGYINHPLGLWILWIVWCDYCIPWL